MKFIKEDLLVALSQTQLHSRYTLMESSMIQLVDLKRIMRSALLDGAKKTESSTGVYAIVGDLTGEKMAFSK